MIRVENLCKTYSQGTGKVRAVDKVGLSVDQGEFVLITGRSGSGKTTLLSLIGGLTRPSSGVVAIGDVDLWRLDDRQLSAFRARKFGFIFQFASLIPTLTVFDNVLLPTTFLQMRSATRRPGYFRRVLVRAGPGREVVSPGAGQLLDETIQQVGHSCGVSSPQGGEAPQLRDSASLRENRRKVMDLLERMGIGNKAKSYPAELSGGQQRRVAIARSLINSPDIILADEPTGDLDEETEAEVMEVLGEENNKGVTLIIVTHNPDLSGQPSKRLIMNKGRFLASQ